MDDERRVNVMPVELAIQRELAYREKVKMLGLQQYGDSRQEYLPLQVPHPNPSPSPSPSLNSQPTSLITSSPSPSLSGIKRKAPVSNFQHFPPQQLKPVDGGPHQNLQPTSSGHTVENRTDYFFCKLCQVPCSGPLNRKQHLRGRQHKAKELELFGKKCDGQKASQRPWCTLCKISCMDQQAFEMHINGQKHNAKRQAVELGRTNGGEVVNQRKWCELCRIWCMNEDAFKQHLVGKKHIVNLHAIGGNGGAEEEEAAVPKVGWEDME